MNTATPWEYTRTYEDIFHMYLVNTDVHRMGLHTNTPTDTLKTAQVGTHSLTHSPHRMHISVLRRACLHQPARGKKLHSHRWTTVTALLPMPVEATGRLCANAFILLSGQNILQVRRCLQTDSQAWLALSLAPHASQGGKQVLSNVALKGTATALSQREEGIHSSNKPQEDTMCHQTCQEKGF